MRNVNRFQTCLALAAVCHGGTVEGLGISSEGKY